MPIKNDTKTIKTKEKKNYGIYGQIKGCGHNG